MSSSVTARSRYAGAIESMNGARFVHDALERSGWEVEVADAQKVKGLAQHRRLAEDPQNYPDKSGRWGSYWRARA